MIIIHKSNGGFEYWDSHKSEVIHLYCIEKKSSNEIAKLFNCDPNTILTHLKRWGISRRNERYNSRYNVDTNFFDKIDTEEKAYFLGLLVADGHVSKNGCLMLTLKDRDVVEKYREALKCDVPIRKDRYGNFCLNIKSVHLCRSLRAIGLNNRKSYCLDIYQIVSNVPKSLEHHFVRGLFDGDGSIKVYSYPYHKRSQLHFGYTGLINVVDYIKEYLNINTKTVKESEFTYTCVSSCRKTIRNIYNLLYRDATVYMERKHKTFQDIITNNL